VVPWRGRGEKCRGGSNLSSQSRQWREREKPVSGVQGVLYYTKQNKLESINEHRYKAPMNFLCFEGLDRASVSPDPPKNIGNGNQNTSRFCGSKGPPMAGHNT
jgi:hypothetical protein